MRSYLKFGRTKGYNMQTPLLRDLETVGALFVRGIWTKLNALSPTRYPTEMNGCRKSPISGFGKELMRR
jgi:hypothetical protein